MNVSPFCCIKTISVTVRSSSGAKLEQSKTCQNGPWAHSSHASDNQYGDSGPEEEEIKADEGEERKNSEQGKGEATKKKTEKAAVPDATNHGLGGRFKLYESNCGAQRA